MKNHEQVLLLYLLRDNFNIYRRVMSSNISHLEPHPGFYRLLMKGVFDAYVPFGEKFIFELLTRVRTRDFTVLTLCCKNILRSIYNCALSETQPKRSDFEKTKL